MKIIIDGPNNVGKTTFIKAMLAHNHFKDFKYKHLTAEDENSLSFYKDILNEKQFYILDRGPIGELVYSEIYKRTPRITHNEVKKVVNDPRVTSLIFTQPIRQIAKNYRGKKENFELGFVRKELFLFNKCAGNFKNTQVIVNHYDKQSEQLYSLMKYI